MAKNVLSVNYRLIHLFFVNSVHHLWIVSKDGRHLWINPEIVKLRLVEAFERHTIYVISELPLNSSWTRTTVDDKMWNTKHNELLPMPSMNKELTHSLLIINNTVQWWYPTQLVLLRNRVSSTLEFQGS